MLSLISFNLQAESDSHVFLKALVRDIHDWIVSSVDLPGALIILLEVLVLAIIGWVLWKVSRLVLIRLFGLIANRTPNPLG